MSDLQWVNELTFGLLQLETIFSNLLFKSSMLGILNLQKQHEHNSRKWYEPDYTNRSEKKGVRNRLSKYSHTLTRTNEIKHASDRWPFNSISPGYEIFSQHHRDDKLLRVIGQRFTEEREQTRAETVPFKYYSVMFLWMCTMVLATCAL